MTKSLFLNAGTALLIIGLVHPALAQQAAFPATLKIGVFHGSTVTKGKEQHPRGRLFLGGAWKILGGGCRVNYEEPGNMLTACHPEGQSWVAQAKDHKIPSPATLELWAVALHDPNNDWDVIAQSSTGTRAPHPSAEARLPDGYALTGGGASVNWSGYGSMLTASFPNTDKTWTARAKDHLVSDPSTATAYVIGIRHRTGEISVTTRNLTSLAVMDARPQPHPEDRVPALVNYQLKLLTGCGAEVLPAAGAGNLLTALYPVKGLYANTNTERLLECQVASKDHMEPSPAVVKGYAIAIVAPDPEYIEFIEWAVQ